MDSAIIIMILGLEIYLSVFVHVPCGQKLEQANFISFMNISFPILNNSSETARSILKDALDRVNNEMVSQICNRISNFII
jgi:hypothetical protein